MTQPGIVSETQATKNLITQFTQTVADQQQARVSAESCEAVLASQWGGVASMAYRSAMADWTRNLDQVRDALMKLQDAMAAYAQETESAEDNNLQTVKVVAETAAASASWT